MPTTTPARRQAVDATLETRASDHNFAAYLGDAPVNELGKLSGWLS
jgi:hypothetical protein